MPARAAEGISSRTQTSDTNALSPVPAEALLPVPDVSLPLPSVTGASLNGATTSELAGQISSSRVSETLPTTVGVPGNTIARGDEGNQNFSLTTDPEDPEQPIISDFERGITLAQGNVVLTYGPFRATGKRGVVYTNTTPKIAQLSDDLTIYARVNGREQVFKGQSLRFNLDTGRWDLSDIRATFPPDLFPRGQVLEPLFLRDGRVFGTDQDVGGSNFRFSSCDEDHYYLQTRQVHFYRDAQGRPDRIVLKKNALYVLGHKILEIPTYVYSLQGQRSRRVGLQPQVGRNDVDGLLRQDSRGSERQRALRRFAARGHAGEAWSRPRIPARAGQ